MVVFKTVTTVALHENQNIVREIDRQTNSDGAKGYFLIKKKIRNIRDIFSQETQYIFKSLYTVPRLS